LKTDSFRFYSVLHPHGQYSDEGKEAERNGVDLKHQGQRSQETFYTRKEKDVSVRIRGWLLLKLSCSPGQ